jgi:hypothetical protein
MDKPIFGKHHAGGLDKRPAIAGGALCQTLKISRFSRT